jgi:hypothetical protein
MTSNQLTLEQLSAIAGGAIDGGHNDGGLSHLVNQKPDTPNPAQENMLAGQRPCKVAGEWNPVLWQRTVGAGPFTSFPKSV